MKTIQISVERNFHIMNDDRFIMEKISQTVELEEGDSIQEAINGARKAIETNFKAAYPKVYTHLNFDEVRQYDGIGMKNSFSTHEEVNSMPSNGAKTFFDKIKETTNETIAVVHTKTPEEIIPKKTIEEQIQDCQSVTELLSFKIIAEMNPKLKNLYDETMSKLP